MLVSEMFRDSRLANAAHVAASALERAQSWLREAEKVGQPALEAGARRFAMTLGRAMSLALLIKHAQWSLDHENDPRFAASARRFAYSGVDLIIDFDPNDTDVLSL